MTLKILNTLGEAYVPEARTVLERLGTVEYRSFTQEELEKNISDYDIAVVGLDVRYDATVLKNAKRLKAIATATTGTDHIDMHYAKENGIEVLSLKGETNFLETITGTSELAFGLLLDMFRNITHGHIHVINGEWDRNKYKGNNIRDKVLGVVGFGRLGKMMAHYGKGFGMRVISYDPFVDEEVFTKKGVEKVSFEELLKESDAISIHVHLTDDTKYMFNEKVFSDMKNSVYVINTSRGMIVNEKDLVKALKDGVIQGYAADVLDGELFFDENGTHKHPLVNYSRTAENVVLTPHLGGMTYESRRDTDVFIAEKLARFLSK